MQTVLGSEEVRAQPPASAHLGLHCRTWYPHREHQTCVTNMWTFILNHGGRRVKNWFAVLWPTSLSAFMAQTQPVTHQKRHSGGDPKHWEHYSSTGSSAAALGALQQHWEHCSSTGSSAAAKLKPGLVCGGFSGHITCSPLSSCADNQSSLGDHSWRTFPSKSNPEKSKALKVMHKINNKSGWRFWKGQCVILILS